MPFDIETDADVAGVEERARKMKSGGQPTVLSVADLLALDVSPLVEPIEGILPGSGATLLFGAPKSNKTLVALQMAIAVASGNALFDFYRVLTPGPVLVVEQDDPAGATSVRDILTNSPVLVVQDGPPHQLHRFLRWVIKSVPG